MTRPAGVPGVTVPVVDPSKTRLHQYTIRSTRREALQAHLKSLGIGSKVYYRARCNLQRCFADLGYRAGQFPESERASGEVLSLPIYPELSDDACSAVVDAIEGSPREPPQSGRDRRRQLGLESVRTLAGMPEVELSVVCDTQVKRREMVQSQFPGVAVTESADRAWSRRRRSSSRPGGRARPTGAPRDPARGSRYWWKSRSPVGRGRGRGSRTGGGRSVPVLVGPPAVFHPRGGAPACHGAGRRAPALIPSSHPRAHVEPDHAVARVG